MQPQVKWAFLVSAGWICQGVKGLKRWVREPHTRTVWTETAVMVIDHVPTQSTAAQFWRWNRPSISGFILVGVPGWKVLLSEDDCILEGTSQLITFKTPQRARCSCSNRHLIKTCCVIQRTAVWAHHCYVVLGEVPNTLLQNNTVPKHCSGSSGKKKGRCHMSWKTWKTGFSQMMT